MKIQNLLDEYNAFGKVPVSAIPWDLLKRPDAPAAAYPLWASLQRRNYFGNLKWIGFQVLQAELGWQEADLKEALGWLSANGFVNLNKAERRVTVVIEKREDLKPASSTELDL